MWPQKPEPIQHPDPEVEEALRLLEEKRRKHQHLQTSKSVYFWWAMLVVVAMAGTYVMYLNIFHPLPALTTTEELEEMIARDAALSEVQSDGHANQAQSSQSGAIQAGNSATGQSEADDPTSLGHQVSSDEQAHEDDQENLPPAEPPEEAE
ncbi:MAG: hypothetical protein Q4C87_08135 [Actinomycetaceae bacterium]|nr:hypothetical protein [Actinomycetaceae bacterium]